MNRIIIAIVVIVLILTFGVLNEVYINNSFNGIGMRCEEVQSLLENKDYEKAKQVCLSPPSPFSALPPVI